METERRGEYISVKEFLQQLDGRLSKNTVYEQIASGVIPSVRISRRILIPADAMDRMLAAQETLDSRRRNGTWKRSTRNRRPPKEGSDDSGYDGATETSPVPSSLS